MTDSGDTTAGELPAERVRRLPWLAIATGAVTVLAIALLVSGGLAAVLGAWLLATAAPLGLGLLLHRSWAAVIPAAFWAAWIAATELQPVDGELPRTPMVLAALFALAGVGATLFAQRGIARAAGESEPATARVMPSIDDALAAVPELPELDGAPDRDDEVDDALLELMVEEAGDNEEEAEAEAEAEAEPEADADAEADAELEAEPEPEADAEAEPEAEAESEPEAQAEAEAEPEAEAEAAAKAWVEAEHAGSSEALSALEAAVASVQAAATSEQAALPEPDDRAGHVIEFDAISEDDIDLEAPLPAQTHAGRRTER